MHRSFSSSSDSHPDFQSRSRAPSASSPPPPADPTIDAALKQIDEDVKNNDIFLYMKGTPDQPRCGFSANVVNMLKQYKVGFGSRDVLASDAIRAAVKQYSDWPTLPQLYVRGQFIGGSDIVTNLFKTGELEKLLSPSLQLNIERREEIERKGGIIEVYMSVCLCVYRTSSSTR